MGGHLGCPTFLLQLFSLLSPMCWSRSRVPAALQRSRKQVPVPQCRLICFQ